MLRTNSTPRDHLQAVPPKRSRGLDARLRRQNRAIIALGANTSVVDGNVDDALGPISETGARTLGVDRVGVWSCDGETAAPLCKALYILSTGEVFSHDEIAEPLARLPAEIFEGHVADVADVWTDPRCTVMRDVYLAQNGVTSVLAAPFRAAGRVAGALVFEHVGPARRWSSDEIRFSVALAGMVTLCFEAGERKRAESALRDSEARVRSLIEHVGDTIFTVGLDGRFSSFNPAFETTTGWRRDEWLGKPFAPIVHADDLPAATRVVEDVTLGEFPPTFDLRILTRRGVYLVLEFTATPLTENDEVIGVLGVARDVTARKVSEKALRESEERYRNLVDHARDIIFTLAPDGVLTSLNGAFERILEYDIDEFVGRHFAPLVHEADLARARSIITRVAAGDSPGVFELRLNAKSGRQVVAEFTTTPQRAGGAIVGLLGVARDVTERYEAERRTRGLLQAAKEVNGRLDLREILARVQRIVVQSLPCDLAITWRRDPATMTTSVISSYGVPETERGFLDTLVFPPGRPFGGILERGESIVINDVEDQTWFPPEVFMRFGARRVVVAPMRTRDRYFGALLVANREPVDFTAAQVQMCEAVARHVSGAMEVVQFYDSQAEEGEIAAALLRVGRELITALEATEVLARLCKVTTEVMACDLSHAFLRDETTGAFQLVAGDGETRVAFDQLQDMPVEMERVVSLVERLQRDGLAHVGPQQHEPLVPAEVLSDYGVASGMVVGLRRGADLIGVLCVGHRRHQGGFNHRQERIAMGIGQLASLALENTRLVAQLSRANRIKSDFLATMSHELRTPLNIMIGYESLLLEGVFGELKEDQADAVSRIDRSARQLLELVNATLDLSALQAGQVAIEYSDVDPRAVLVDLCDVARQDPPDPAVRLRHDIPAALPSLRTDRGKLQVVLRNLLSNALKFTDQGEVVVSAEETEGGIAFRVRDTGIGIAPELQAEIFESFRQGDNSSTRRHDGTGLGLHIVQQMLDVLGGRISFQSTEGRGSTFEAWVPLQPAPSRVPESMER